jgi:hypothetical protein
VAEQFPALAAHLATGSGLLAQTLGEAAPGREGLAARMHDVDHDAELRTHALLSELAGVFVTPVDRVDVYRLAWSLRLCSRALDDAIDLIAVCPVLRFGEEVTGQVQLVSSGCDAVVEAMPRLVHRRALSHAWLELTRLRKQAGTAHRRSIVSALGAPAGLRERAPEVPGDRAAEAEDHLRAPLDVASSWRIRVADQLLATSTALEDVGHVLQQIVVKES